MRTIFLLIFLTTSLYAQNRINQNKLYSNYALKSSRVEYRKELNSKIDKIFSSEISAKNEKNWKRLFKEVGLMLIRDDKTYQAVKKGCEYAPSGSLSFQRAVVEIILTLYPNKFKNTIDQFYETTSDPTLFSYCTNYYLRNKIISSDSLLITAKNRFPDYEKIPQINFLVYYFENPVSSTPPLADLLSHSFMKGKTILYSFQRENRRFPGITIIKKPDGGFVKGKNDTLFYVQQLAYSVTDLPGYLSQGNTPQGIFSVVGFYNSPTPSIGPTAAVLTRIPFEVPTKLWYHNSITGKWRIEDYKNLLPKSWREYLPIYEAFYAGKTGRRKIVMHGSVDDLDFYDSLSFFPLTPSKGCLTTVEIWNDSTGYNIRSDQSKLMNAFFSTGELEGFLVVININDKKSAVTINEVKQILKKASLK